jgi:5-formyltetrahydrofolate cyclo-ligase
MGNPSSLKIPLRALYQERLNTLPVERREAASNQAIHFLRHWVLERADDGLIAAFAPYRREIDLWPLLKEWMEAKKLVLPRLSGDDLEFYKVERIGQLSPNLYGIMEPHAELPKVSLDELSLILVPGLAFDNTLNRLGRGLGIYDRLLVRVPPSIPRVGIGFQEQLSENPLPIESHDFTITDRLLF